MNLSRCSKVLVLCLLALWVAGSATAQQPAVASQAAEILVYKKWIGASGGKEADVLARLQCEGAESFEPQWVNTGKVVQWPLATVPPQGMLCSVHETEEESFIADTDDCLELRIFPGDQAECTLVNTKLVKRIDMLNRYGRILMILVMLAAGLLATRKFGPAA